MQKLIQGKLIQENKQQHCNCLIHSKPCNILLISRCLYICQDCAIFLPEYRDENLLEAQKIPQKLKQINQACLLTIQKQKQNKILTDLSLKQIIHSLDQCKNQLIEQIQKQYCQIRNTISNQFLVDLQISKTERITNGGQLHTDIEAEQIQQVKIKKYQNGKFKFAKYINFLNKQQTKIKQLCQQIKTKLKFAPNFIPYVAGIKQQILNCVSMKNQPSLKSGRSIQKLPLKSNSKYDQFLLDFSEFNTYESQSKLFPIFQNVPLPIFNLQHPVNNNQFCKTNLDLENSKKESQQKNQRRKTATCLQDLASSIDSISKKDQVQLVQNNSNIFSPTSSKTSLQTERSISVTSVISKIIQKPKSKLQQSVIQICYHSQLQNKLQIISPSVKIIKFKYPLITTQELIMFLKQKISQSFVHTLEFQGLHKINEKILIELKNNKCKSLKKLEFRQCREIKWNDKKVKEIIKKLETDSIKVVY